MLIVFASRDVIYFYVSGLGYVRNNYTATTVEIPCDIEIEVDLTVDSMQNPGSVSYQIEYPDKAGLTYSVFGYAAYIYDDIAGLPHMFKEEEGTNYRLQFTWEGDKINPFEHTVITPVNAQLYADTLVTKKTVTGDGPNYDIPVDNISVEAGGNIYTPVWYETLVTTWQYNHTFRLGLFDDPDVLQQLQDDGVATATVKITKLYKTVYTIPGLDCLFDNRVIPSSKDMVDAESLLEFRCTTNVVLKQLNSDRQPEDLHFVIGDAYSVIPGKEVVASEFQGEIYNQHDVLGEWCKTMAQALFYNAVAYFATFLMRNTIYGFVSIFAYYFTFVFLKMGQTANKYSIFAGGQLLRVSNAAQSAVKFSSVCGVVLLILGYLANRFYTRKRGELRRVIKG